MEYFKSILGMLGGLNLGPQDSVGSSSQSAPECAGLSRPQKINDYVYEVHKPAGRPSVEIVFFHGFQLENSTEAYITTWISRDKSELWLNWLPERFPGARILTISYDGFARRTGAQGIMDMYLTRENLINVFTGFAAHIGQDGCPVVLVGHCLGGLVMKELCVQANSILSLTERDKPNEPVENLLSNIQGLFFYASPHHGSRLADRKTWTSKGLLFEDVTTLNEDTARRNEDFRKLRQKYGWKAYGVGESRKVTLGNFTGFVVPEASARHDVNLFHTIVDADHFDVCRPKSRTSDSYHFLSDFVARIIDEDKARFSLQTGLPTEVMGLEPSVKRVQEKLEGAPRLAIVGIGGIGKTTLAKVVFDSISRSFEYTCFLSEVKKSMAEEEKLTDLHKKIVDGLYHRERKVDPQTFCWRKLKEKKVLIILDDAEFESQVLVMTERDNFSDQSRLVVTSRDSRFLIQQDFDLHVAESLGLHDSKRLFCLHAFKTTVAPQTYEEHVTKFVEKCGGLPLALKVAGRYLYKQKTATWDDAFKKLSRAQSLNGKVHDGLWSILITSYESLACQEKEMFLDVATCFHGEILEGVQKAWEICTWASSDSGWENLVDRCLVSARKSVEGTQIWMHEMLRDLGRSIACPDPHDVASHSRVFDISQANQLTLLSQSEVMQEHTKVKVLKINDKFMRGDFSLELGALHRSKELEIVWLDGVQLGHQMHDILPNRVVLFFKLESFPQFCLPNTLGYLQALQHLDISECGGLEALPDILRNLKALQHLVISRCFDFKALPDTLGNLQALQHLEIRDCFGLEALPDTLGSLQALQHLVISPGFDFKVLPDTLGNLQALKHLEISFCLDLKVLPDTLGNLQALQHLVISFGGLKVLPDTLGNLHALQHLEIISCSDLKALPATLGNLQALQHFVISYCVGLEALPDTLGNLQALQHLDIRVCNSVKALPDTLGSLLALQHMVISGCDGLEALPDSLGNLQALQHLVISGCAGLETLPDSLGNLQALQHLVISCFDLEVLPDTLGNLQALKHLEISFCLDLKVLPDTLGNLQALQHLDISGCDGLKALPDTLGNLQALQHLEIRNGHILKSLPGSLGNLQALQHLEISGCNGLEALPDSLGNLQALQRLEITQCSFLEVLPNTLLDLWALQHLKIRECRLLRVRFSLQALPRMTNYDVVLGEDIKFGSEDWLVFDDVGTLVEELYQRDLFTVLPPEGSRLEANL